MDLDFATLDHSTLSRRKALVAVPARTAHPTCPIHLFIDATGLKMVGDGVWHALRHNPANKRSCCCTLQSCADAGGFIIASTLTSSGADDPSVAVTMIQGVGTGIGHFTRESARETRAAYEALTSVGGVDVTLVIPPMTCPKSRQQWPAGPPTTFCNSAMLPSPGSPRWGGGGGVKTRRKASIRPHAELCNYAVQQRRAARARRREGRRIVDKHRREQVGRHRAPRLTVGACAMIRPAQSDGSRPVAPVRGQTVRIERIVIHKLKHIAPHTELRFGDGVNVVLGKNGTGKTTLLRLLTHVARLDFSPYAREDCRVEATLKVGATQLDVQFRAELVPDSTVGQVEQGDLRAPVRQRPLQAALWSFECHLIDMEAKLDWIATINSAGVRTAVGEGAERLSQGLDAELSRHFGYRMFASLIAPQTALEIAQSQRRPLRPELVDALNCYAASRYDEALGTWNAILAEPHSIPPDGPVVSSIRIWKRGDEPSAATYQYAHTPLGLCLSGQFVGSNGFSTRAQPGSNQFASLTSALDVHGIEGQARLTQSVTENGVTVADYEGWDFRIYLDDKTIVSHDQLSFGQKRLFAFFWYLACIPHGVVIADELVNGFHHDWIAACLDEIGERQAFVASQNPLLMDFLTYESAGDIQTRFVLCSNEAREGGGHHWRWRNFDPDEAARFFAAYEGGIQHVNEILRLGGWW